MPGVAVDVAAEHPVDFGGIPARGVEVPALRLRGVIAHLVHEPRLVGEVGLGAVPEGVVQKRDAPAGTGQVLLSGELR